MRFGRRIILGVASTVAVGVGTWYWREATRVHTVIITVPDAPGFFAVWRLDAHPDVVEVRDRVARFSIPQDGLLRARSMACIEDWHTERYVDRRGQAVDDVHSLGSASYSWRGGAFLWWYRGAETNRMYSGEAKEAWLRKMGIAR
jgi:hypothetical protein